MKRSDIRQEIGRTDVPVRIARTIVQVQVIRPNMRTAVTVTADKGDAHRSVIEPQAITLVCCTAARCLVWNPPVPAGF